MLERLKYWVDDYAPILIFLGIVVVVIGLVVGFSWLVMSTPFCTTLTSGDTYCSVYETPFHKVSYWK